MTVSASGKVILQEDPGTAARSARIWQYDPESDGLVELARHDQARFGNESGLAPQPPFNTNEESSGVVDVTGIFGEDGGAAYLLDVQAHYPFGAPGSSGREEIVEGGQLLLMRVDAEVSPLG